VAEAFASMYMLETACSIQVRALGMGRPIHPVKPEVVALAGAFRQGSGAALARNLIWPAMLRKLDRLSPGWADEVGASC